VLELLEHDDAGASPMTKPSRSRSNGREAFSGASLRVERARMEQKRPRPAA